MRQAVRRWCSASAVWSSILVLATGTVLALQVPGKPTRFDALLVPDPTTSLDVATTPLASLESAETLRGGWEAFRAAHGPDWSIYLDRRSGAPLLVEGKGIPWGVEPGATVDSLAASLRTFALRHRALLLADDAELVLNHDASGRLSKDVWQIAFGRAVSGVPVAGERYLFTIGHGNLIAFGAPRWSRIDADPVPDIDATQAVAQLASYLGLTASDGVKVEDEGSLKLIPLRAPGAQAAAGGPYDGPLGAGYASALVWRIVIRVDGEPGTWEGLIDAHTGAIRSFNDINAYARAKGGVYPASNDGIPEDGVEQPGYPMPFANITIGGSPQTTSSSGLFDCTPGGSTATTTLSGPYVRVVDACGAISQSITCDADLDLSGGPGTDCDVPLGSSAGNTHASRTGFYHLNRIAEHARAWLPANNWLKSQVPERVNVSDVCNAVWDGVATNFFRSGGGCSNTGELVGVVLHEWGHGLDQNDGGGFDNPTEAYADITAILAMHISCMGRGFRPSINCGGYGNACLSCTGIRDLDWDQRADRVPSTPSGFVAARCPGGSGPCGKEIHCEGYVGGETLWDLAVRDLPAAGLDPASAWQLTDKLWYTSRLGSGGNAYNCALPSSDGCAATSWFGKLRAVDDDDGNLANGTPHAAAIFAAFNRHNIACGAAADPSNQSTTTCPAIGAATLNATAGSGLAQLTWTPVAGAASYNILRNDASCGAASTIVANVPGTTFFDLGLANGFAQHYAVQAVGASAACEGLFSNCRGVTPHASAGLPRLDAETYSCSAVITVTVTDANVGAATTTVKLSSATEPVGETITLTRVAPLSSSYVGTISTTGAAAAADGLLSVGDGDTITAAYVDVDDGQGGVNLTRPTLARADCASPVIANVASSNVTGISARITWDTDEAATSVVRYGLAPPPGATTALAAKVVGHAVELTGLAACSSYVYAVESTDAFGNTALDDAAGLYYAFTTVKNTTLSHPSTDTPVAIPDNLPQGAASTINVSDNKPVLNVKVTLNLTHPFDGDLVITLTPPVGPPISLSNRRGGPGNDFAGTVFDDAAAASITAGTAPFTGSFRPETPLSAANGINAAGAWQLKVVDAHSQDAGTIDNWTLTLTYPPAACGPHAVLESHATVADACATGGAGSGNTAWDGGELLTVKLSAKNDGTTTLTGVTAAVASTTPGVVMLDGTATFPSIPPGAIADSLAPHVTLRLPANLACGGTVAFDVAITGQQGAWSGSFSHGVGLVVQGGGSALNETFGGGIPATWTIVDGGVGGGAAATWTTANPGARSIAAPMAAPVAIVDSDNAGNTGAIQDEQLITPPMNLSAATAVTLQFDQYFFWYVGSLAEIADVDVRTSATAGAWVNVLRQQGAASTNPDHKSIDISATAAGQTGVQARFRYHNAQFEWYWQVDNVKLDTLAPTGCSQHVCAAAPGSVKPVADGSFGTAMKGSRAGISGSTIDLTWDVSTCSSTDHHVLYGSLSNVATSTISGSHCDLGTSGSATWSGVPSGSLWFVVVGDNDATMEGSWGTMTGGERGGASASGQCGLAARDNSGTCP